MLTVLPPIGIVISNQKLSLRLHFETGKSAITQPYLMRNSLVKTMYVTKVMKICLTDSCHCTSWSDYVLSTFGILSENLYERLRKNSHNAFPHLLSCYKVVLSPDSLYMYIKLRINC